MDDNRISDKEPISSDTELDVKKSEQLSNEDLKIKILRVKTNVKAGPFFARCN